ncbi:hypothetical protein NIT60_09995 [Mammaliicoccus sciuri]|nr:hypothetical protein NIT60_09995 [Mammaliicoccus sciuri]
MRFGFIGTNWISDKFIENGLEVGSRLNLTLSIRELKKEQTIIRRNINLLKRSQI